MPSTLQVVGIVAIFSGSAVGVLLDGQALYVAAAVAWAGVALVWIGGRGRHEF